MATGNAGSAGLVRSRERVADHGEVFTPRWMVDDMLDLVRAETERIDSRFLEPACGAGNFLVPILERKLAAVRSRYRRSEFETRHYALLALMCVYGIELLADNVAECRANLLRTFTCFLKTKPDDVWSRAGAAVLEANIVRGDALKMVTPGAQLIAFPEWGYLGRGRYQRRDFRYDALAQRASFGEDEADDHRHEIFTPIRSYPPMTAAEIAERQVVDPFGALGGNR